MLEPLPDSFVATREGLHALAEHVLAPARYHAEGRIGLVPTAGGFGTPIFGDGERVRVEGTELVHERPGTTKRIGITTLAAAAQFVDVPLGAPTDVYKPATVGMPDVALAIDATAAQVLAAWYAFAALVLDELRETYGGHDPSDVTIWPEHFDAACELGDKAGGTRANYGASPGDAALSQPYFYVGPWDEAHRTGPFAAHPWGAGLAYDELRAVTDPRTRAVEFVMECAALLLGHP
jgi:hypothetical protein